MEHPTRAPRSAGRRCLAPLLTPLLTLLLTLCAADVAGLKFNSPPGTSGGQVVITEGDTLTLSCEDEDTVRLTSPPFLMYDHDSPPEIIHRRTTHVWNSSFVLRGARPAHSGYYNCTSQSEPLDQQSVYVYVKSKSPERPWVMDSENARQRQMMTEVSAHLHKTATLDCRPNDPTAIVRLRDSKNRTLSVGRQSDGAELTWDPRVGFRLGPVEMRHSGVYWCAAEGRSRNLQLKLQVVGLEIVPPMLWANKETPMVARGSDITLTCELALLKRVDFNLTWSTPTGRINEGYRYMVQGVENDPNTWQRRTKMLYVFNVKDSDVGDYTCTADDGRGNRKSTTYRLQLQGGPANEVARAISPSSSSGHHVPHNQHDHHGAPQAASGGYKFYARTDLLISAALSVVAASIPGKIWGFTSS